MPDPPGDDRPARPIREVIARDPEVRRRVGRVYAELLGVILAAVAGLGALLIWHLARRGRLVRDRLGPPRPTVLPGEADDDRIEGRP